MGKQHQTVHNTAHRLSQSLSSFVLNRFDSRDAKERDSLTSSQGAPFHDRKHSIDIGQYGGRKSSFGSSPGTPMKVTSELTPPSTPVSSVTDLKAVAVQILMQSTREQSKVPSEDGDEPEVVVPFDDTGDIFMTTIHEHRTLSCEEGSHHEPDLEANHQLADV